MATAPNPIPPIYGYIAQPRIDPSTGQTVYVAAGRPVLMPYITPQGEHILVYHEVPEQETPKEAPRTANNGGVLGTLSNIGKSISKATSEISHEITNAFNNAFK